MRRYAARKNSFFTSATVAWGLCAAAISFFVTCDNPFLPRIGVPATSEGRSTPAGVLRQLVNSYESRSLPIFQDLFDRDGSMRYYVPSLDIGYFELLSARSTPEIINRRYAFIDSGASYTYLPYSDEEHIHKNLFEQSDEIVFKSPLSADSIYYYDSLVRVDSSRVVGYDSIANLFDTVVVYDSVFDTTNAEARTIGNCVIEIASRIFTGATTPGYEDFEVGRQVFYLKRDPLDRRLWVIDKWFELEQ